VLPHVEHGQDSNQLAQVLDGSTQQQGLSGSFDMGNNNSSIGESALNSSKGAVAAVITDDSFGGFVVNKGGVSAHDSGGLSKGAELGFVPNTVDYSYASAESSQPA